MKLLALLLVVAALPATGQQVIPYPYALRHAGVRQDRLDSVRDRAFLLGNGDITGLLYTEGGKLVLRLTKNDVWDARLDTGRDPPILTLDLLKRLGKRDDWLAGNKVAIRSILADGSVSNDLPSWQAPHPAPLSCGRLVLEPKLGASNLAEARATNAGPAVLEVETAAARVPEGLDRGPAATVRALAQRNVFLIESEAGAALEASSGYAGSPPAQTGESAGVRWIRQTVPGDPDWPGMVFAVALAEAPGRKAVAIATSLEANDPLERAVELARSTLRSDPSSLIREHERHWREFWSRSGVDLEESSLRDAWHRNLYFFRSSTKPGVQAPGLFAGKVADATAAWHGGYTINYNTEQTYWTPLITNHPELAEPYDRLISSYLPRGRYFARTAYGCEGAAFPHNLFAFEPPPEQCRSALRRMHAHHTWGYTIGVSGFAVQNLWWHYKYEPSRELLEKVAYPAVREVALFYADFIDKCDAAPNGKVILAPSTSPEHWGWTTRFQRNRNGTFDITMIRHTFRAAIEAARTLGRDANLVRRFRKAMERLPDYPLTNSEPPIVVDVQDAPPITYNIAVPAVPVFPGEQVTWFSPDAEKQLFARTIDQLKWNGNNSSIILSVARARLSMPDTWQWVKAETEVRLKPNGTLGLNRVGAAINNHGHYTEQFAAAMAVSELLLQSVDDVIRVFPAWPVDKGARFANLRAQGGFLISAEQSGGKVRQIAVVSTAGGELALQSPWPSVLVSGTGAGSRRRPLRPGAGRIVRLNTASGQIVILRPE